MFAGGGDLALVAGVGTGKTATLVPMAATSALARPRRTFDC